MQPTTPSPAYKYDVFISYSRKNGAFADQLLKTLESYRPAKDLKVPQRYLEVFLDKEDFTAGDYEMRLNEHLRESAKLIVICSPEARKSRYVNSEIRQFIQMRGADHVIPILFSGIPNNEARPGQEAELAFPEALCEVMKMPLAINYLGLDVAKEKLNKGIFADAWHSTLANIYGVSRSELEQREKKRHARRRRLTFSVLSGSVAVLSILLVFALVSRSQAVAARVEADRQKVAAVTAREAEAKERERAEAQERVAKLERDRAVDAEGKTKAALERETIAKDQAEERRKEAERERQIAEEQRVRAEQQTLLAEEQTLLAEERARVALARQLAVQAMAASEKSEATAALGTVGNERSVLLALESLRGFQTIEGTKALRDAIARLTGKSSELTFTTEELMTDYDLSPEGKRLAYIKDDRAYVRNLDAAQTPPWLIPIAEPVSIAFSQDGRKLATLSLESTLIWEVTTQKQISKLPPMFEDTTDVVSFSSDGSQLIRLSRNSLEVWDINASRLVRRMTPGPDGWKDKALSSGGDYLLTRDRTGLIKIFAVATGREVRRALNRDTFYGLGLSRDGSLAATMGENKVEVWRVKGWRKIATLPHEWQIAGMAFSRDGRWLTTVTGLAGTEGAELSTTSLPGSAIRVWDLKTERPVMHVSLAQEGGFSGFSFAAQGERLLTVNPIVTADTESEGAIEVKGFRWLTWTLLPEDLARQACSLLTRNLSRSEWATFMGKTPYRLTCKGLPEPYE